MRRHLYLATAVLTVVMISAYAAWCCSKGIAPGDDLLRIYAIVMAILIVSWLVTDPALPASRRPSFDYGLLLWVSFPFLAAYHMYATRGWRGILLVLGLILLFLAPYLAFGIMQVLQ